MMERVIAIVMGLAGCWLAFRAWKPAWREGSRAGVLFATLAFPMPIVAVVGGCWYPGLLAVDFSGGAYALMLWFARIDRETRAAEDKG